MVHSKLVSIIMPNYNKGNFAVQAVRSVLNQSYPHIELIFVDDHSTDGSDRTIREMGLTDLPVKLLTTPNPQSGGGVARNIGIRAASGEMVVFLDSDDWMHPACIHERMELFERNSAADFLVFQMGIFYDQPGDSDLIVNCKKESKDLERFFLRDQPWLISGPIWKKSFLEKIGCFDESLDSQQDADLHIRALIETENYIHFYGEPKVFYRQNVRSIPRAKSQSYKSILQRSEMLKKHIGMLSRSEMLTVNLKSAIAQYLLDLAQMLRWHKKTSESNTIADAYAIWTLAYDYHLVSDELYRLGMSYIRFKHNMLWNRFPEFMRKREQRFSRKLGGLKFVPSETLSKTRLNEGIE
jgi:glycosyltransferase involved in cell wall biosynthesis